MCCIFVYGTEIRLFWLSPGPLFSFDVHDDIRLVNDATVEKDEVRLFLTLSMSDPHFGQEPPKLTGRDLLVCLYVMFLGHVNVKLDRILVENHHLCFRICFYSVLNNSVFQRSDATNLGQSVTCVSSAH